MQNNLPIPHPAASSPDGQRCSKPGRRQYVCSAEIPTVMNGLGISIVSTSSGVMTGAKARKLQIGGELIALIW